MNFSRLMAILTGGVGFILSASGVSAQSSSPELRNITVKQYLREAGGIAKYVAPGRLRLAGRRVLCGRRPSILDPEFDTWAGAYTNPGFIIVNPRYMKKEKKSFSSIFTPMSAAISFVDLTKIQLMPLLFVAVYAKAG